MRSYRALLLPAILFCSVGVYAQDIREAYNFSNLTVQGSASSMGYGNALGSLGGDFSAVSVNPAALGIYGVSEVSITPSIRLSNASSSYAGTTTVGNNGNFNINEFGLVFTHKNKGRHHGHSKWKEVSFALGMNRTADFNRGYTFQGNNNTSSASQAFESDANLNPTGVAQYSNTLGAIGYNSYLLNQNANGQYITTVPFSEGITQMKSMEESGGINEFVMSLAGNYKNKLMLGITLGMPVINYQSNSTYTESSADNNATTNPTGFTSFNYNQSVNISGVGFDTKIGAIYKFNNAFRIGLALHSPTFYSISDVSKTSLYVNNDSTGANAAYNGVFLRNSFDYNLITPWKGVLSATFTLKRLGFITADYEYVDYSSMRYAGFGGGIDQATGNSFQSEQDAVNQTIQKSYQGVSNFRIGAGFNVTKFFIVRIGAGYYGNAYTAYGEANNLDYTTQRIDLNAGLGFHFKHFFTDLGFVHSMYQGVEQPYSINYGGVISSATAATIPQATTNYSLNNMALTMGFRFK